MSVPRETCVKAVNYLLELSVFVNTSYALRRYYIVQLTHIYDQATRKDQLLLL